MKKMEKINNLKTCIYENNFTHWKCRNEISNDLDSNYCILHDHEIYLTEDSLIKLNYSLQRISEEEFANKVVKKLEKKKGKKFKGKRDFLNIIKDEIEGDIIEEYQTYLLKHIKKLTFKDQYKLKVQPLRNLKKLKFTDSSIAILESISEKTYDKRKVIEKKIDNFIKDEILTNYLNYIYAYSEKSIAGKDSKIFAEMLECELIKQKDQQCIHLEGIYFPRDFMESYKVSSDTIFALKKEGISDNTISKLKNLEENLFIGKEHFSDNLESTIGQGLTNNDKAKIIKNAYYEMRFKRLFNSYKHNIIENAMSFAESVFFCDLKLFNIRFNDEVNFGACLFLNKLRLDHVTFSSYVTFAGSVFFEPVKFHPTSFQGVDFKQSIFENKAVFTDCVFRNYTTFNATQIPSPNSMISFEDVLFFSTHRTWFKKIDMSKLLFKNTNLRFVKFINVNWAKPKWFFVKRKCISGEFENINADKQTRKEHFSNIRSVYQELKLNFEEARNYGDAGDFHYGEMECKRKSIGIFRFLPSLTTLYWLSSGYGERPLRAFFILLLIIVIWIFSLMSTGIEPNDLNNHYNGMEYKINFDVIEEKNFKKDFFNTFIYIQEILLREEKSDRIFHTKNGRNVWISGDFINTIGFILTYLQLLLFFLAIRRKFTR